MSCAFYSRLFYYWKMWKTWLLNMNENLLLHFRILQDYFHAQFQCVIWEGMCYCRHIRNLNILKYCNIPTKIALEIRSIGSRCVRDNTWIARAFSVVCSVCWFSYRDKSFQSIDSLLWSSWSYFIYELNSKALMQPVGF